MTAGFQSFAADGSNVIQIDSETGLPNFQLRAKMTQTLQRLTFPIYTISDGSRYSSGGWGTTFSFNAINPCVVFECGGSAIVPESWANNGNAWTVRVVGSQQADVTIYIMDTNDWGVRGNLNGGLQVFNGSGQLIADATTPFLKPVGFWQGNPKYAYGQTGFTQDGGTWDTNQGAANFPVPQRVGFACVQPAYVVGSGTGQPNNAGVIMSAFSTNGPTISAFMVGFGDNSTYHNYNGFRESLSWSLMAVDISFL